MTVWTVKWKWVSISHNCDLTCELTKLTTVEDSVHEEFSLMGNSVRLFLLSLISLNSCG